MIAQLCLSSGNFLVKTGAKKGAARLVRTPVRAGETPISSRRPDERPLGPRQRWGLAVGVIAVVVVGAAFLEFYSSGGALPQNSNIYVDPNQSSCKGGSTFSCTVVLDAKQGAVTVAEIKSVTINGTVTQPSVTASGDSVTIVANLQSISMVRGLGDVGPSQRPPTVGTIVVDITDGTEVSVTLGAAGILP